jgi:hypothetical protein
MVFGSLKSRRDSMFPCLRATCNLFCAGPSVTFDSSGHSTRRIVIRKAQAALKTAYHHETTVLTTIPPNFLTITTVRVPVSADKRIFHLDILKLVKVRNANEKIVISVSNASPQIVAAQQTGTTVTDSSYTGAKLLQHGTSTLGICKA